MGIVITTNNVPRFVVDAHELTPAERADNDWVNWQAIEDGTDSASFVRYRGVTYPLADFSAHAGISRESGMPRGLDGWDGYLSDTYFSGVVIRWADASGESVVMGTFYVRD